MYFASPFARNILSFQSMFAIAAQVSRYDSPLSFGRSYAPLNASHICPYFG